MGGHNRVRVGTEVVSVFVSILVRPGPDVRLVTRTGRNDERISWADNGIYTLSLNRFRFRPLYGHCCMSSTDPNP